MNNETLKFIQGQIGYAFKNSDLLQQAFVRRSYSKEEGGEDNEVLEFIGDKALDFIVVKLLAEKYGSYAEDYDDYDSNEDCNEFISDFREGKLTEIKKKLVCREMLASRIRIFGFQYELIMGKSDSDQNVHERDSVQEDLFEAILGAVALDCSWNWEKIDLVLEAMLRDYRHVAGSRVMIFVLPAVRVDEIRIFASPLFDRLVHQFDKLALTAGNALSEDYRGIVG
jgi:ribonuclease-3